METVFPRRWQPLIFGSLVVGTIILFFGWTGDDDDSSVIGWLIVTLLACASAYALWRFVAAPRLASGASASAAVPALILGILSLLLGFLYWTGLIYGFGPVAIVLGLTALPDIRGRIGFILGCVGMLIGVVGGFVDSVL